MRFLLLTFGQLVRLSRSFQIGEAWICRDSNFNLRKHEQIPRNLTVSIIPGFL